MNNKPSNTPRTDAAVLSQQSGALYDESCRLERELHNMTIAFKGGSPDSFAYASIEEYEALVRFQVNEAFKSGWMMARTRNSHIVALQESVKTKTA